MKVKKKPVVIEAWQYTGKDSLPDAPAWVKKAHEGTDSLRRLVIPTLEGVLVAKEGDWILQGVKGEVYPCRRDIFEDTYIKYGPDK